MRLTGREAGVQQKGDCTGAGSSRQPTWARCRRNIVNVLIVYGTTEGQTRKIAAWTATHIRERGHQVELQDSAALASDLKLGAFHAFIIAASVHQEHHQETVTNFVICASRAAEHQAFSPHIRQSVGGAGRPKDGSAKVRGSLRLCDRVATTHDPPSRGCFALHQVRLLPGAVRQIRRHEARGDPSPERDHEFTDWNALADFVDRFLETAG